MARGAAFGGCLRAPLLFIEFTPMSIERLGDRDPAAGSPAPYDESGPTGIHDRVFSAARALIASRQNVSPKRLDEPGPSPQQLDALFSLAATAPDHGLLLPWRFVIVPRSKRRSLSEVFALALLDRDPGATTVQVEAAREKANRAPLLILAVVRFQSDREPEIPDLERVVSLGCALQNLQLGAHAMGFGCGLTSGQAMASTHMRELFTLNTDEHAVCFLNIGTVAKRKPGRIRPSPDQFLSTL